ncbi:hypothetical protein [Thermomonas sp.]|uniref:hypothetical protein n=1 Tax=Thermomonas sp. TaxID=1971895 RepID=UPI00248A59E5|nr:hypothetical protein [Thermomonas sp.]MDI1254201.1 hypothetical protein [Thermomonas sp.]
MRAAEIIQRHPLLTWALSGLVAGATLGLVWPVIVPAPGSQRLQQWKPPQGLDDLRPSEKEFATARDAPVWGGAAGSEPGVKRTVWRLAGIISDPFLAALVFSGTSTDAQRIRIGGSLPDGGVIKQIAASGVVYALDGCSYGRDLYAPAESAVQGSCDPGAPVKN